MNMDSEPFSFAINSPPTNSQKSPSDELGLAAWLTWVLAFVCHYLDQSSPLPSLRLLFCSRARDKLTVSRTGVCISSMNPQVGQ